MTYTYEVAGKKVYVYINGKFIGRIEIHGERVMQYPEKDVMWLPVREAVQAMRVA